jgi:hypothetical protein
MRELSAKEVGQVNGALGDGFVVAGVAVTGVAAGTTVAAAGAALLAAFGAGFAVGTWGYNTATHFAYGGSFSGYAMGGYGMGFGGGNPCAR